MSTIEQQRRDAAAAEAARNRRVQERVRGEGMRIRLSKIDGVTRGDALKVLKVPYYFQCAPLDSFTVPTTRTFPRYTNYQGTEYLQRGGSTLQALTFRTLVVEYGRFVIERDWNVERLVKNLQRITESGWPFELLATHQYNLDPEVQMDVVLESCIVVENAGEADARYLDLSFVEWRAPIVQRKALGTASSWPKTLILGKNGTAKLQGSTGKGFPNATLAAVAVGVYRQTGLGKHIAAAQKPPITNWGLHTPLIQHPRYKGKGGKLIIPKPPAHDVFTAGKGFAAT